MALIQKHTTAQRARIRLALPGAPDLIFWACLLALNLLLFLPVYLLNVESTAFLPFGTLRRDVWGFVLDTVVARPNFDIFRLNVELFAFAMLWVHVKQARRRWVRWGFTGFYLLVFCYYVYEGIFLFIYFVEPVFYGQVHLLTAGLPFVLQHLKLPLSSYLAIGGLLLGLVATICVSIWIMTERVPMERLSRVSRWGVAVVFGVAVALAIQFHGDLVRPEMVVSSFFAKLQHNAVESMRIYREVQQFDDGEILRAYDYAGKDLETKPNIYLIFIESYGSVLYKRPDWAESYPALLAEIEAELRADGWCMASALSEAPVWGGGSWMSYTSALFGLRIDNDPQYLSLFDTYQYKDYPDLASYLRAQGYDYAWLSSLSMELKEEKWVPYSNFYDIDRWLRYRDLEYEGPEYGWGPAPPDQYALNFARESLEKGSAKPFALFTITQNSHYPWGQLPEVVDDWRALNDPSAPQPTEAPELMDHAVRRQNYFDSIVYQLEMLSDFIRNEEKEDTIFVLVGDHQPPQVSRRADGWDTPIHLIGRDRAFVESFTDYGFEPGMGVETVEPAMRHEGFYSLFVRLLLQRYGEAGVDLPVYLPDGVSFNALESGSD